MQGKVRISWTPVRKSPRAECLNSFQLNAWHANVWTLSVIVFTAALWILVSARVSLGEETKKSEAVSKKAAVDVKTEIASFAQVQEIVAKHRGKVIVVDYWSSWCPPCVKELPEFVQLHNEFGDKIVCLTFDVDFAGIDGEKPEDHRENVQGILAKHQATMRNFISSDPDLTVFKNLKVGSVPALQVFDRTGKLHMRFDNENEAFGKDGFSVIKHVRPVVLELLK